MRFCKISGVVAALFWLGLAQGQAQPAATPAPPFLTADYAPQLLIDGAPLTLAEHRQNGAIDHYAYVTANHLQGLVIERLPCSGDACAVAFNENLQSSDKLASTNHGDFRVVTTSEYHAVWKTGSGDTEVENHVFVFRYPDSLEQWSYSLGRDAAPTADITFNHLLALADRRRYESARAAGAGELRSWSAQAKAHADRLLDDGHKPEALAVLQAVIAAAPADYDARMDFANNSDDKPAAKANGAAVFADAESPELIAEGAALTETAPVTAPFLDRGQKGPLLILVPVEPSDIRTLSEAAPIYQAITGIPAKVMRLEDVLYLGVPDRVPDQRLAREQLVRLNGATDFTGWTLERYTAALKTAAASAGALERFRIKATLDKLEAGGGQFEAGPILAKFNKLLALNRAPDRNVVYVGVTSLDISEGEFNFLFSTGIDTPAGPLNLLSYNRMLAENSGAAFPSRKRLVERIAKQLVPPSLAALGIPRPTDPLDPYSFADSVARVDQKTLTLSQPTKDALAKILTPEKPRGKGKKAK